MTLSKNFKLGILGLLLLAAVFSLWSFAHADGTSISMCVKHTGVGYLVGTGFDNQTCKSNEELITFNVTGPQGMPGIQGPIGPQGPEGKSPKLYDGNGNVVGYVQTLLTGGVALFVPSFRAYVDLDLASGQIVPEAVWYGVAGVSREPYYLAPDCFDPPYLVGSDPNTISLAATNVFRVEVASGEELFVPDVSRQILIDPTTFQSYLHNGICVNETQTREAAVPVRPFVPEDIGPGPYHIGS